VSRLDWNAAGYHRVSAVQEAWGVELIGRIPAGRYRRILDAGCGSGRLTAHLMRAFPRAEVTGLDRSAAMIEEARRNLHRFARRLRFHEADLLEAAPGTGYDLAFSNATFHWVLDHAKLFRNLAAWLSPGGRLVAQCGGAGNLDRADAVIPAVSARRPFASRLHGFRRPVNFAQPDETRRRLARAGFHDMQVWLHEAPTPFPSRSAFRDFVRNVILVPILTRLEEPGLCEAFVEEFVDAYGKRYGKPYLLDYVRLTTIAVRK
jgi:trans-aconitate 2-methyltransferase